MLVFKKRNKKSGFSLIEMLIAVALFAIVAIVTTQSLTSSLRNSKKSESLSKSRENVEYTLSTMERLLRNAKSVTCAGNTLNYVDEYGTATSFVCNNTGGYVASGSANLRLTSSDVVLVCSGTFTCPPPAPGVPASVLITLTAKDANYGTDVEGAFVTSTTKVLLRNYTVY